MIRSLILTVFVASVAFGQLFDRPANVEDRKSVAPPPTLLEMPYEKTTMPNLGLSAVSKETSKSVNVPSPFIDVRKRLDSVVDIPHTPIPVPRGGVEEVPTEYKLSQPVIEVPEPILQKKPVYFNVLQPIIQVPEPVIRHRPVLYKVPHVVKLHRPIVKHERIFYKVPGAQIRP